MIVLVVAQKLATRAPIAAKADGHAANLLAIAVVVDVNSIASDGQSVAATRELAGSTLVTPELGSVGADGVVFAGACGDDGGGGD